MRGDHIQRMLALELGESIVLEPNDNDTADALYARVRKAAKRHATERSFRVSRNGQMITVARCNAGQSKKLSWLLEMGVGDTVFYSDAFTEADYKKLWRKFDYWMSAHDRMCRAERHPDGKIYIRLIADFSNRGELCWVDVLKERGEAEPISKKHWVCAPFS